MKNQQGNALVLVLIAVALMAALSFAITRGQNDSGGKKLLSSGQVKIVSAELIKYAKTLENGVQKVMLVNNCSEAELSAYSPLWPSGASDYDQRAGYPAPTDKRCHIFDVAGAGIPWQFPTEGVVPSVIQPQIGGTKGIAGVGLDTCSQTELLFTAAVTREMCLHINSQFNITNTGGEPPQETATMDYIINYEKFGWHPSVPYGCGSFIGDGALPNAPELIGEKTGCWQEDGVEEYNFYHVLLAR